MIQDELEQALLDGARPRIDRRLAAAPFRARVQKSLQLALVTCSSEDARDLYTISVDKSVCEFANPRW